MKREEIVDTLKLMAAEKKTPAEMLRFLVLEQEIEQQLEWMTLFSEAFDVTLGEVTALSGWWHDESAELNDNDINAYISPLIKQ
ncbi:hypothetical protein OO007_08905 [Cocleimonas sp. KMM 6892]|uniref:hypothetical protein n=1 Tax=unclassified Cocleimonas TaxID=2639732 RepID=UPI002DBEC19A|nr:MULTISPECIES: hypothetical protein [unclassified Cocleimonas]MEB8432341.1 hypothetical protein [Cocleimonas sp. KMM 6892]MEC4714573.1 hypothetical protein [Cocleimonas sp. KMM 6895]MEC4744613.1 hypothetical protein [Cocleimonas sp. KMM 6896]